MLVPNATLTRLLSSVAILSQIDVMVEYDLAVSPPSPAPTDASYVGCFNDMIDDRIMSTVLIMEDLTPEVTKSALRGYYRKEGA